MQTLTPAVPLFRGRDIRPQINTNTIGSINTPNICRSEAKFSVYPAIITINVFTIFHVEHNRILPV